MRHFLLSFAAATLSATPASAAGLAISDAWIRLPAVSGRPAAAYFMITGGDKAEIITGISSPSATRAELHASGMSGGLMKMSSMKSLTVGKGEMVMFQPGGRHVMLFGLDTRIKPGSTVRLNLKLANGNTVSADAKAMSPADQPPMEHQHNH